MSDEQNHGVEEQARVRSFRLTESKNDGRNTFHLFLVLGGLWWILTVVNGAQTVPETPSAAIGRSEFTSLCRGAVEKQLKALIVGRFGPEDAVRIDLNTAAWTGYVDTQSSSGPLLRVPFSCTLMSSGEVDVFLIVPPL